MNKPTYLLSLMVKKGYDREDLYNGLPSYYTRDKLNKILSGQIPLTIENVPDFTNALDLTTSEHEEFLSLFDGNLKPNDIDNILSELITDIEKLNKNQVLDRLLIAKNSVLRISINKPEESKNKVSVKLQIKNFFPIVNIMLSLIIIVILLFWR